MQKRAHVVMHAKKKSGGKKGGKITHMVFRGAKNGLISETHRKQPPMSPSEPYQPNEPEMNVHANADDAMAHFKSQAGDFDAGDEAGEEAAEKEA